MRPKTGDDLIKLIDRRDQLRVAIIPNAWDPAPNEQKKTEVKKCINAFKKFGFTVSILELTETDASSVEHALNNKDLVWVMGGNTFYLNFYMHKSGFKDSIRRLLQNGLVYGGESAGAVVVGPSLRGIEYLDNPSESPKTVWEGLKLLDFGLIPHWGSEGYGNALNQAKTEMEQYSRVATINNDQAFIIEGEELELINIG